MTQANILVFGGTRDAREICLALEAAGEHYCLSVASEAGRQRADGLKGDIITGRMDAAAMVDYLREHEIGWVIDAAHPYAEVLRHTVASACQQRAVPLTCYQRPSDIDALTHPLLHKVDNPAAACALAQTFGPRVLLTTGSKQLAEYQRGLAGKHLMVRVLPTAEVLAHCEQLGLAVDRIFALCGPFTADINRALYQFCQPDVVITKESGAPGGYQDKVLPCLERNIPCIVVQRPPTGDSAGQDRVHNLNEFALSLARWQQRPHAKGGVPVCAAHHKDPR